MCSSSPTSFLFLSHGSIFNPPTPFLCFLRPTTIPRRHLSASLAHSNLGLSWFSPTHGNPSDDFGGWAFVEYPLHHRRKKEFPSRVVVGIGASLALLVALIASFKLSRQGCKVQFTSPLQGILSPIITQDGQNKTAEFDTSNGNNLMSEVIPEAIPVSITETVSSAIEKPERVTISVSVDSTQEEAMSVLKSLKIIEDDVEANELCTRREFARWLVELNSSLERNPKHRIAPIVSLSGSVVTAFDDISVEDQDFRSIQVLAEAGVIPSKLSWKNRSNSGGSDGQENINFFPDRFISRQDLMDWRVQLEYEFFSGVIDQSRYQLKKRAIWM